MIKKRTNTFEGGLDQDLDKKLLPPNKYYAAENFTLTKDGKVGVMSTINGFDFLSGGVDYDDAALNFSLITIRLNDSIDPSRFIFEYDTGGGPTDLNADTTAITTAEQLEARINDVIPGLTTYTFQDEVYIEHDGTFSITDTDYTTVDAWFVFDPAGTFPIPQGTLLFSYTPEGGGSTNFNAPFDINDAYDLQTAVEANFELLASTVLSSSYYYGRFVDLDITSINATYFNNDPTLFFNDTYEKVSITTNLSENNNFVILGVKEVPLTEEERLIFIWKQDGATWKSGTQNGFYIQVYHYNFVTKTALNTGYIAKTAAASNNILEKNIIYDKRSEKNHAIYWNDGGANPDRVIKFSISINPNDYASWSDYVAAMKAELLPQTLFTFEQIVSDYIVKPEFYNMAEIPSSATNIGLKTGECVLCFYRLKNDEQFSNISLYSNPVYITRLAEQTDGPNDIIINIGTQLAAEEQGVWSPNDKRFSVTFVVEGLDTPNYDEIEFYFIHYNDEQSAFKIREGLKTVISDTVYVSYSTAYDATNAIEVPGIDALLNPQNLNDSSITQTVFKNRRIKANLRSSVNSLLNDFDARAYRFNDGTGEVGLRPHARLYDTLGTLETTIDSGSIDYTTISETKDCINPYNDEYAVGPVVPDFATWQTDYQYKYQSDGITLGGEGQNVSYRFTAPTKNRDFAFFPNSTDLYNKLTVGTSTYPHISIGSNTGSKRDGQDNRGFMAGETYRFFLCFWKGDTPTLSKWVGDIKFPEELPDYGVLLQGTQANDSGDVKQLASSSLGIEFEIDTSSIKDDITAVSIGVVPRTEADKSVIFTAPNLGAHLVQAGGAVQGTYFSSESGAPYDVGIWTGNSGTTPELLEVERLMFFPFDLQKLGILDGLDGSQYYMKPVRRQAYARGADNDRRRIYVPFCRTDISTTPTEVRLYPVDRVETLKKEPLRLQDYLPNIATDYPINNSGHFVNTVPADVELIPTITDNIMDKTFFVLSEFTGLTNAEHANSHLSGVNDQQIVWSLRRVALNQYGGDGYLSRLNNTVELTASVPIRGGNLVTINPQGDSYNVLVDILYQGGEDTDSGQVTWLGMLPSIECSKNFHRLDTEYVDGNGDPIDDGRVRFFPTDSTDLTVAEAQKTRTYSKINQIAPVLLPTTTSVSAKSFENENTNLILFSEKKVEGLIDSSWETFPVLNEKIIDPNMGEILALHVVEDRLIVIQQRGVAQQFVDQVQQQVDEISQISLGTGAVAGQHVYIYRDVGIEKTEDAIEVNGDIIFRDTRRAAIYSVKLGEIPGLKDLLRKDVFISGLIRNIIYDKDIDVVFIPNFVDWIDSSEGYYITYDNTLKGFVTDKSFDADLISTDGSNGISRFTGLTNMMRLDKGFIGVFNTNPYPVFTGSNTCKVTFIVNPEPNIVKTFDTLTIDFEAIEYDVDGNPVDVPLEPPLTIQCKTEYQDTGVIIPVANNNIRRLGRIWRFTIPRDSLSGSNDRMRGYYMEVIIAFDSVDREIKLNSVTTSYRTSNLPRV